MKKFLKVLPQYLAPQHTLTRVLGWLCESRWSWLKNWMIQTFIRRYQVNMQDAQIENPLDYPTFNHFFIRHLKPELRPVVQGVDQIACLVDGCVSQIGKIAQDSLFQAKGFYYNLSTLLGNEKNAMSFIDGNFATLYLAPRDYHRVHMPCSGTLRETTYIPGQLFSVNQLTTSVVPKLFTRNERLVCLFDTEQGPMAIILVGAMLVGSIHTTWDEAPCANKMVSKNHTGIHLNRGEELGYFKLGSTVIVVFGKNKVAWNENLQPETHVKMGELLGSIIK